MAGMQGNVQNFYIFAKIVYLLNVQSNKNENTSPVFELVFSLSAHMVYSQYASYLRAEKM